MDFEPSGDLLTDIASCIEYGNPIELDYVDRKGQSSTRKVLPLEIRDDGVYVADLDKMGLRLFKLHSIGSFIVLDEHVDKDSLSLS